MAQVPYQPFATAEPQAGGEKIAVSTPGAAFGENVGAALQQLGSTGEQVGNELFGRAMALQDLKNENDARAAQSEYAEKASLLHAQFGSQLGKDANDQSLQAYIKARTIFETRSEGPCKPLTPSDITIVIPSPSCKGISSPLLATLRIRRSSIQFRPLRQLSIVPRSPSPTHRTTPSFKRRSGIPKLLMRQSRMLRAWDRRRLLR